MPVQDLRPLVLFVCTANLCRSPLAEHLMRARLGRGGPAWDVASAGAAARGGQELLEATASVLREMGVVPAQTWRTTRLRRDEANRADLVLTAEAAHRRAVVALAPACINRTFTLLEFAALLRLADMEPNAEGSDDGVRALLSAAWTARGQPQRREHRLLDIPDPIDRGIGAMRETSQIILGAIDEITLALSRSTVG